MMKTIRTLFALLMLSSPVFAQGQLPSGNVWGNATAGRTLAAPTSVPSLFDRALGSTQGMQISRGAAGWRARLNEISVGDYAVGDGNPGDGARIQAVFDAAAPGHKAGLVSSIYKVVFPPAASYYNTCDQELNATNMRGLVIAGTFNTDANQTVVGCKTNSSLNSIIDLSNSNAGARLTDVLFVGPTSTGTGVYPNYGILWGSTNAGGGNFNYVRNFSAAGRFNKAAKYIMGICCSIMENTGDQQAVTGNPANAASVVIASNNVQGAVSSFVTLATTPQPNGSWNLNRMECHAFGPSSILPSPPCLWIDSAPLMEFYGGIISAGSGGSSTPCVIKLTGSNNDLGFHRTQFNYELGVQPDNVFCGGAGVVTAATFDNVSNLTTTPATPYVGGMTATIAAATTTTLRVNCATTEEFCIAGAGNFTGVVTSGGFTSGSTSAVAVAIGSGSGRAFVVDSSAASARTGVKITAQAAGSGANIAAISSGTNENLNIDAKGTGAIQLNGIGTGPIIFARGVTASSTINGITITTPGSPATLTIASGKTVTDTSGIGSNILVGTSGGGFVTYAGTSCTNQFVRSISSTGAATCATVANTDLANSGVTIGAAALALGGTISSATLTAQINAATASLPGLLPAWPNDATKFFRGDNTYNTAVTSATIAAGVGMGVTGTCAITTTGTCTIATALSMVTNALSGDVALNNTASYFDGPSVAQGSAGTWFASGAAQLIDTAGGAGFKCKLWDGTTVIASAQLNTSASTQPVPLALSGHIVSPAGNIRISCQDVSSTSGSMKFNQSGNSKDSTVSAFRIQ